MSDFNWKMLDENFIRSYSAAYWMTMAETLKKLIKEDSFSNDPTILTVPPDGRKHVYEMQLHMLVYHAVESFLALLMSVFEHPENFTQKMTSYKSKQINSFADQVKENGLNFQQINGTKALRKIFYGPNKQEPHIEALIEQSIAEIDQFIRHLAKWWSNHQPYNAFKHGFRTALGHFGIRLHHKEHGEHVTEGSSYNYLNVDEDPPLMIYCIFNSDQDYNLMMGINILFKIFLDARRQRIAGKDAINSSAVRPGSLTKFCTQLPFFFQIPVNKLGNMANGVGTQNFRFDENGEIQLDTDPEEQDN